MGDYSISFGVSLYPMAGVIAQSKYGPPFIIDHDRGSRLDCSINGCKRSCCNHICPNMENLLISVINNNLIMTIRLIRQTLMRIYIKQIGPGLTSLCGYFLIGGMMMILMMMVLIMSTIEK